MKGSLSKVKSKITKFGTALTTAILLASCSSTVHADVITDYDSSDKGALGSSSIFTGVYNLISNLAAVLQWVIPIAGVAMILWYVFRIMTGDEQDQQRYKKGLIKIIVCIVIAEVAVVLINLIASYFGE